MEENAALIEKSIDVSTEAGKVQMAHLKKYRSELSDYNKQRNILNEINAALSEVRKTADIAKKDIHNFNQRIKNGETEYDGNDIVTLRLTGVEPITPDE